MKWRIYLLNNRKIKSSECDGFLHTAKTDRGTCMACGEPVSSGMEYVLLNYYDCPDPLHKNCFINDHPSHAILGIKRTKINHYSIMRSAVICKDFSRKVEK